MSGEGATGGAGTTGRAGTTGGGGTALVPWRAQAARLAAGAAAAAVAGAGQAGYALLAGPAVSAAVGGGAAARIALAAVAVAAARGAALIAAARCLDGAAARIARDLRVRVIDRLGRLPLGFFRDHRAGDLAARATEDVRIVEAAVAGGWVSVAREAPAALALALAAAAIEPRLFLIALAALPVAWGAAAALGRATRRAAAEERAAGARLAGRLVEGLVAAREVRAAGGQDEEAARAGAAADDMTRAALRRASRRAAIPAVNEVCGAVGLAAALLFGQRMSVPPERLISFFAAAVLLYKPARGIGQALAAIAEAAPSRARLREVLDRPAERTGGRDLPPLRDAVEARELRFRHPGATGEALRGVSLRVRPGEVVALCGPSGAGKTTLAHLLCALQDPGGGEVRWDGVSAREADPRAWRARCALVGQQPVLWAGSVRDNIGYGAPPGADLAAAARAAGVEPLLAREAGERGAALSAGEAQRVAIARALARGAGLIVLDEPSSALDPASEAAVARALRHAARAGAAVVVVSHRDRLSAAADRAVRLRDGRIEEAGPAPATSAPATSAPATGHVAAGGAGEVASRGA